MTTTMPAPGRRAAPTQIAVRTICNRRWPRSWTLLAADLRRPEPRLSRPLTTEERAAITARIREIEPLVVDPEPAGDRAAGALTTLLTALSHREGDRVVSVIAEAFSRSLAGLPLWAIEEAADRWLREDVSDWCPRSDTAFAPRPTELRRVAAGVLARLRGERDLLLRLIDAPVEVRPTIDFERRRAQVAAILPRFGAVPAPADPVREMTDQERAARIAAWARQIEEEGSDADLG